MVTGHQSTSDDPLSRPKSLLRGLSQRLGRVYNVSLPVPEGLEDFGLKDMKEFSTGLLETSAHPWAPVISGLKPDNRLTIAGSLFLWRKILPAPPVDTAEFVSRVTASEDSLPDGYLAHVARLTAEIFEEGWDKVKYLKNVEGHCPTVNSVKENGRAKGGYRKLRPDRYEFGNVAIGYEDTEFEVDNRLKFLIAPCDGKDRAVTIMSSSAQVLGPLHKTIYDHLTEKKWLLRGEAKPAAFEGFNRVKDEVFVSGDYEAASDHLPLSVAELILKVAFKRSKVIPKVIKEAAFRLLRAEVEVDGEVYQVTRQLMGSLLCFPLLCLQNYIAFRYVYPDTVPVKVNGDDIVFRSDRARYLKWAQFVNSVGLKLSVGKTMVSHSHFSLNSTFFKARWYRNPGLIPVVRCTTLLKASDANSLAGSYQSFLKGCPYKSELREVFGAWFLEKKKKIIQRSGRSVKRGLGINATDRQIKESGLWCRELFYFNHAVVSQPSIGRTAEAPLPEPPSSKFRWTKIPAGWKRKEVKRLTQDDKLREEKFFSELVDNTWELPPLVVNTKEAERDYWDSLAVGGFESDWNKYRTNKRSKLKIFSSRFSRTLAGLTKVNDLRDRTRLRSAPFYNYSQKKKKFTWVYENEGVEESSGESRLTPGEFALTLLDCDDEWCRPFNKFIPPVEDNFIIYQGWHGLSL
nr:RNA dependent RNA polymerase [Erysiphe necator associated ourmia-like virus 2]